MSTDVSPDSTTDDHRSSAEQPKRRKKRVSRMERGPEPHDWRWFVGGVGRTLISVGVLMFAFVGYQLYGTGIQTAQAQSRLADEFDELRSSTDLTAPPTTDPPPATNPSITTPTETLPPAPVTTVPVATVPAPLLSAPPAGDPLARLVIESIDLDKIVIEGVRPSDLEDGPGHFPETPIPGQYGNAAIAGHRTTHGQPFNRIDEIDVGDEIIVETLAGRYVYIVTGQAIVSPNDYQAVIPTTDPTTATLTLTSCHPKFSARQRIVIFSELDPTQSDLVTAPSVADPNVRSELPIDDVTATTVATDGSVPGTTPTAPPVSIDSVPGTIVSAPRVQAAAPDTSQDLFENRWFSDPDAVPHVAVWGIALIAIALGATSLSRRFWNNWIGGLAGIVPFIVVLYFFFENVNRLLPPNL